MPLRDCALPLLVVILTLLPHSARALDLNRTVPVHCKGRFDLSSSALANLAYEWTHHSKIHDWSYSANGRDCVVVGYTTQIQLKAIFKKLLPSRVLHVRMRKHACARGDVLFETINLSELLLIDSMEIKIRAELDQATDSLLMHAYSEMVVPWLLQIFTSTIMGQIEDSVREYQDMLARSICNTN